jgi:hypothetical protein
VRLDSAANASTPHRHGTVCSSAARDVESSGPGSSVVEVDEPDGFTIPEHGVPRPKIAVAHDVGRVHRRTRVEGFVGRETGDRDVIIAQQPRERPQPRLGHYVCPAVGATLARDEAHDFVAVDDVEQARSRKPDRRKVTKQVVHRRRPWMQRAPYFVATSFDPPMRFVLEERHGSIVRVRSTRRALICSPSPRPPFGFRSATRAGRPHHDASECDHGYHLPS